MCCSPWSCKESDTTATELNCAGSLPHGLFSSCHKSGYLLVAVHRLLTVGASLAAEHKL